MVRGPYLLVPTHFPSLPIQAKIFKYCLLSQQGGRYKIHRWICDMSWCSSALERFLVGDDGWPLTKTSISHPILFPSDEEREGNKINILHLPEYANVRLNFEQRIHANAQFTVLISLFYVYLFFFLTFFTILFYFPYFIFYSISCFLLNVPPPPHVFYIPKILY